MTKHIEQLITLFFQQPSAMTQQQARELSNWITKSKKNTRKFIEASLFHRCIHEVLLEQEKSDIISEEMDSSFFEDQLRDMASEEEVADETENRELKREFKTNVKVNPNSRKSKKTAFLATVAATAAVIYLFIYLFLAISSPDVGVAGLKNMVDAQWESSVSLVDSDFRLVPNHEPLILKEGYAELVFDNNAEVTLESPVKFQVISGNRIKVDYGRIHTMIPKQAQGFTVVTPASEIIDLGTEFGVQADIDGTTQVHVVKGKASLVYGKGDKQSSVLLSAGSAKKMSTTSSSPVDIKFNRQMFVRKIDSKNKFIWRGQNINLADIVGGGNGFGTGRMDKGIDVSSGRETNSLYRSDVYSGPEGYVRVESNSFIDGVFVPGYTPDSTQINSKKMTVDDFAETSGKMWGYIFNGAWHQSDDTPRHNLKLNRVTLGGGRNSAITMHSNTGITFDLSEIRKRIPGVKIKSLSSSFGISETVEKWIKFDFIGWERTPEVLRLKEQRHPYANFWVFVDGEKVVQQKLSSVSAPGEIDIPIDESSRFLTFAVTEADDTFMFDWAVFAQPELILELEDE